MVSRLSSATVSVAVDFTNLINRMKRQLSRSSRSRVGFCSSACSSSVASYPRPKDPASRTVLILAGGLSDPSTWVSGRLKRTASEVRRPATALSFPKTAVPRAVSPMQRADAGGWKTPVTDRSRGREGQGSRRRFRGFDWQSVPVIPEVASSNQTETNCKRGALPTALLCSRSQCTVL